MYFIKKIFKKACYQFTGRYGIKYFDGQDEFLLSTNNYVKNKLSRDGYSVIIYEKEDIRSDKLDYELNEVERMKLITDLKILLEANRIIVEIED